MRKWRRQSLITQSFKCVELLSCLCLFFPSPFSTSSPFPVSKTAISSLLFAHLTYHILPLLQKVIEGVRQEVVKLQEECDRLAKVQTELQNAEARITSLQSRLYDEQQRKAQLEQTFSNVLTENLRLTSEKKVIQEQLIALKNSKIDQLASGGAEDGVANGYAFLHDDSALDRMTQGRTDIREFNIHKIFRLRAEGAPIPEALAPLAEELDRLGLSGSIFTKKPSSAATWSPQMEPSDASLRPTSSFSEPSGPEKRNRESIRRSPKGRPTSPSNGRSPAHSPSSVGRRSPSSRSHTVQPGSSAIVSLTSGVTKTDAIPIAVSFSSQATTSTSPPRRQTEQATSSHASSSSSPSPSSSPVRGSQSPTRSLNDSAAEFHGPTHSIDGSAEASSPPKEPTSRASTRDSTMGTSTARKKFSIAEKSSVSSEQVSHRMAMVTKLRKAEEELESRTQECKVAVQ